MAQQLINIGQAPNDKSGDLLRTAFTKINDNFTELYSTTAADVQIPVQTNNGNKFLTTNGSTLSWDTVGKLVNGNSELVLNTNGNIAYPGDITQSHQDNTTCSPSVSTVVYTSTGQYQHAIKLFVMAEGFTDGGGLSWDTQACDVIAVKGYNNNIVHVTTYGVTYSGSSSIATFDGRWNATTNRIEITCQPVSLTNSVTISVHAIELNSND